MKKVTKKIAERIANRPKRSKEENAFTLRRWDAATPIAWTGPNPHREGTYQHNLREATKRARTVAAFIALAATVDVGKASTPSDFLKGWTERGLVKIGRGRK